MLLGHLSALMEGLPSPERVVLHYLGGKIEAEVFFPCRAFESAASLDEAQKRVALRLRDDPYFRVVSLHCTAGFGSQLD